MTRRSMWMLAALNGVMVPLFSALAVMHTVHGDTVQAVLCGVGAVGFLVAAIVNLLL